MDLTFGNITSYGGILIRAIKNVETGEYIIGPCNVVNHILKQLKQLKQLKIINIDNLVLSMKSTYAFCDKNIFYLKKRKIK